VLDILQDNGIPFKKRGDDSMKISSVLKYLYYDDYQKSTSNPILSDDQLYTVFEAFKKRFRVIHGSLLLLLK